MRTHPMWLAGLLCAGALCVLTFAGCGSSSIAVATATSIPPTATPVPPTATPTTPPAPNCSSEFDSSPTPGIIASLTNFTPPVLLPPVSRVSPDDAAGLHGFDICSAGTAASVTTFMTTNLATSGYAQVASDPRCFYQTECWTSSTSALSWQVTDPTLWRIAYHLAQ